MDYVLTMVGHLKYGSSIFAQITNKHLFDCSYFILISKSFLFNFRIESIESNIITVVWSLL